MHVLDIAMYVIQKCIEDRKPITNRQLQTILYYIQIQYYKENRTFLFNEDFEAWQSGPTIPLVYYRFCSNGVEPITFFMSNKDIKIKKDIRNIIDPIIEKYQDIKFRIFNDKIIEKDNAWSFVYNNGTGHKEIIKKEILVIYK